MGEGGEVFALDLGEPVRILDMAHELIRLSGLEPDRDIPIVFTGAVSGEKIFEDILTGEEGTAATHNSQIFKARVSPPVSSTDFRDIVNHLEKAAENNQMEAIRRILSGLPYPTRKPPLLLPSQLPEKQGERPLK